MYVNLKLFHFQRPQLAAMRESHGIVPGVQGIEPTVKPALRSNDLINSVLHT